MLRPFLIVVAAGAMLLGASAAVSAPKIKMEPVVSGLNQPLAMVETPDGRMFVIEQWGRVMVVEDGELQGTPLLDIRNLIIDRHPDFDERGLLGIALHPEFESNGKFYVAYSGELDFQGDLGQMLWYSHSNVVAEYTVSSDDPNVADPRSGRVLMSTPWPQFNHNGHWIEFGPDGMLYVAMGDGGYANDWGIGHNVLIGNGQDLATPLGKILRIDPETGDAAEGNPFADDEEADPRIFAYGLRNPWRCSFDQGGSNELFCADVQQNSFEEVNIIVAGGNYGWRRMEASKCFNYAEPDNHPADCDKTDLILPIMEYNNCSAKPDGCHGISITGGYVYRGAHKAWDGAYIYGDWSKQFGVRDGQIKIGVQDDDGKWTREEAEVVNMEGNLPYILSFAQDNAGEVYALTSLTTGPVGSLDTIYKITPAE
ncbi:MAG: PQQ-dependent sugar dehydrogenase [Rhodobacteraceae bacterium]|nr:PQQ-dependent sugar dehydrogenase [Paracoccaceae bacterium]